MVCIKTRIAALLSLFVLCGLAPALVLADQTVEVLVYYSPECSHCTFAHDTILQPLSQAYGDRLIMTYVDITQAEGLAQLEATEKRLGQQGDALPIVVIGDQLISTDDDKVLATQLKTLLRERLGEPGKASTPPSATSSATPSATPGVAVGPQPAPALHLAYVQKDGCEKCARATVVLEMMQQEYPSLVVSTFNNVRDAKLIEAMGEKLGIPHKERLVAPAAYVGSEALVGEQMTSSALRALLSKYAASGAPAFWEGLSERSGETSILARFQAMGPWTVVLAAAIDGINPCAFATIIFFVSYLAISQRPRRELIIVGLAFMLGVFVTYLVVGLGAMSLLKLANKVHILARVLYGAFAASCFVFAGLSIRDYTLARKGRLSDMTLRLPDGLRERVKKRIRRASNAGEQTIGSRSGVLLFIGLAFVSGLFVSFVELACTGQVYLPTISFVVGIPQMRAQATLYLLLYNLIFVTPLLVVLLLSVYGISAARFQELLTQNVARTKMIMAVLFVLLGILLLTQVLA